MIAALTITIGWWIIPMVLTAGLYIWAWDDNRSLRGRFSSGLPYVVATIPVLGAWCAYLLLALVIGIR